MVGLPQEAQSKYVSDVIKTHLFLQDILTLLAKSTKKIRFSGLLLHLCCDNRRCTLFDDFPSNAKFTYNRPT